MSLLRGNIKKQLYESLDYLIFIESILDTADEYAIEDMRMSILDLYKIVVNLYPEENDLQIDYVKRKIKHTEKIDSRLNQILEVLSAAEEQI